VQLKLGDACLDIIDSYNVPYHIAENRLSNRYTTNLHLYCLY